VNAARVTMRGWTLGLRDALRELASARLCWCLVCHNGCPVGGIGLEVCREGALSP
jgi:hypothetical protein